MVYFYGFHVGKIYILWAPMSIHVTGARAQASLCESVYACKYTSPMDAI